MKNFIKTTLLLSAVIFLSACSTTNFNPGKPEMSLPENYKGPKKTLNQFKGNWSY